MPTFACAPTTGRLSAKTGLLLWLLAAWWLSSQYLGYNLRDGLFYSAEALRRLEPGNFVRDPFFIGQSQGNFSLFGGLYAQAVQGLGLPLAGWLMSTLGRGAWALGVVLLARALLPTQWLGAVALMLLLPASYDGYGLFSYGESEVTARCWAEAGVLFALAAHFNGRQVLSWALVVLAAGLHPLMALSGGALLLLLQAPRRRNIGLGLAALAILAAALLEIGPFAQLFRVFDADWWASVVLLTGYVLVQAWQPLAFAKMLCWALLLGYAAWQHPLAPVRQLARMLLGLMLLLLGLWAWASFSQNVLLVQLQLWRVLWLCQLLAPALWWSALPAWRSWDARLWTHVLLIAAAVLSAGLSVAILALPAMLLMWPGARVLFASALLRKLLLGMAGLLLMMALAVRYPGFEYNASLNHFNKLAQAKATSWFAEPMWTLPATLGLWWLLGPMRPLQKRWQQGVALLICLVPLGFSLSVLQTQLAKARQPVADASALQALIPPGAVVYWDQGVSGSWFKLHRAHYAGPNQGVTSLFSKAASLEFKRRFALLEQAGFERNLLAGLSDTAKPAGLALSLAQVRLLCQDPALDFILLSMPLPEADTQVAYPGVESGTVSVFRCRATQPAQPAHSSSSSPP